MAKQKRLIDPKEPMFLEGPKSRRFELWFAIQVFWEFLRGFRGLHFIGPCVTVFGSARFKEGHPHYEAAADFVARFDQNAIDPTMPTYPIEAFAPMVHRLFARPPSKRFAP